MHIYKMSVYECICVFDASSTTTALHKHFDKTLWLTAKGNLTFLSVYFNVPSNMPVSYNPVSCVPFDRCVNRAASHSL